MSALNAYPQRGTSTHNIFINSLQSCFTVAGAVASREEPVIEQAAVNKLNYNQEI